jgi:transcriptional regulator GlxA family with amidase domain
MANRVVDDGNVITAGGLTAGLDLGLWIIEREVDAAIARNVADAIEYLPQNDVWQAVTLGARTPM